MPRGIERISSCPPWMSGFIMYHFDLEAEPTRCLFCMERHVDSCRRPITASSLDRTVKLYATYHFISQLIRGFTQLPDPVKATRGRTDGASWRIPGVSTTLSIAVFTKFREGNTFMSDINAKDMCPSNTSPLPWGTSDSLNRQSVKGSANMKALLDCACCNQKRSLELSLEVFIQKDTQQRKQHLTWEYDTCHAGGILEKRHSGGYVSMHFVSVLLHARPFIERSKHVFGSPSKFSARALANNHAAMIPQRAAVWLVGINIVMSPLFTLASTLPQARYLCNPLARISVSQILSSG
mmetsp:Transcript_8068/g.20378  ORF Transcript_8068/g.20378 Transcript_8068/m.20378 type:complete len:295 (-) Transcript_8068:193-1077(-)